jgi:hypothetical protein
MSHWLKRFSLLAVLVLSQALYAGHATSHISGDRVDCQICLQASGGSAVLVSGESRLLMPVCAAPAVSCHTLPAATASFPTSHPTRAPPSYPV